MTKPLGIRSTGTPTVYQQKQYRREFAELKALAAANPSAQTLAYQEANRKGARANSARRKIAAKRMAPLAEVKPLTQLQYEALGPARREEAIDLGLWTPAPAGLEEIW